MRHDAVGENVLLELTDTKGLDMAVELHLARARRLVMSRLQVRNGASSVAPVTRQ